MTTREVITNTPLSGAELKILLMNDFIRLLANEGMLQDFAAFGRAAYEIRLTLHTDNHLFPESVSRTNSRVVAKNVIQGGARDSEGNVLAPAPHLAAVETFPLKDPSSDASMGATEIRRMVDSPNAERLRNEIPVPVMVDNMDGSKRPETVKYPKDESLGEGDVTIIDVTRPARQEFGQPLPPSELIEQVQSVAGDVICHCGHVRNSHALSGLCTGEGHGCGCDGFLDARTPKPTPEAWPAPTPGRE